MKKLVFLFLALFMMGFGFCSQSAKKLDAVVEISSNLNVFQKLNFTMQNDDSKNASSVLIMMPFMPERFDVVDSDYKLLNHSTSISNGIFVIKINDMLKENGQKNYIVRIYDGSMLTNLGDIKVFTYNLLSYYELEDFSLKLVLPSDYAITSGQGNAITPLPSKLYSSNDGIILEWSQSVSYLESKSFFVFFEKINKNNYNLLIVILTFILSFMFGSLAMYLFLKKGRAKTLTQVLSKDEKAIIDLLIERKDLTQKDIGDILDLSKPKLSKLISGLSRKGIIDIVPHGRKNKILLKKEVI